MHFVPEPMNRESFANWLRELADAVASGDSMEGSLEYLLGEECEPNEVMVQASVRTGNLMGQGGLRWIGRMAEQTTEGQSTNG